MRARDAMLYRWMQSKTHQVESQTQQGLREKSGTTVQSEFQTRHPTLIPPRTQSPKQSPNLRGVGRVEGQSAYCVREQEELRSMRANTLILMAKPRGLSENARLRNRFQARCKKVVHSSKRRTGRSYCRRASPTLMKLRGKRSPPLAKRTGHPFTLSFDVVATRRLTRKISSRVFLFIYLNRTR